MLKRDKKNNKNTDKEHALQKTSALYIIEYLRGMLLREG